MVNTTLDLCAQETVQSPSPMKPDAQESKLAQDVSLFDLLIAITAKRRLILFVTALFFVGSVLLSLILPSRYMAKAILMPPQQTSSIGAGWSQQLNGLGSMSSLAGSSLGLKNPNDMYVAMIRSRVVEDAVIQRFGLMKEYRVKYLSEARLALEEHVTVDGSGKDNLIHISGWDHDPKRAAEIVNGYIEEYRKFSADLAITEAAQRRLFLEKQMEQAKDNLADSEEALKRTEQSTGLIQLDSQAKALIETAATLRAKISASEVRIKTLSLYAQDQNIQVIEAKEELAGLREQLSALEGSGNRQGGGLIVPGGRVAQAGVEYVRRLRDVKYYETIFDIIARQYEQAKFEEAKQGAVVQIIVPAIPPDKRSFPKRTMLVLVSTGAGLLIGIIFVAAAFEIERFAGNPTAQVKIAQLRQTLVPAIASSRSKVPLDPESVKS